MVTPHAVKSLAEDPLQVALGSSMVEFRGRLDGFQQQVHRHTVTLLCTNEGPRSIKGETLLVVVLDDLLQLGPADRELLSRARLKERVHLYPPAGSQLQPESIRPVPEMLTQVLAEGINPPVSVPSHGPDASTRGLVLRALLGNDGTREVCFERMAAG